MKIHRSQPRGRFTIIPDETLRDPRLSYQARGVLAEILSRPDDWHRTADEIWRRARRERGGDGEGRKALRAVFAELEACGYLKRVRLRTSTGQIATDVHVYDIAAGHTDDQAGGPRPDHDQDASSQFAPTTSPPTVGGPDVGARDVITETDLRTPMTKLIT